MALIAQAATLESRVPFLHFFDGFRTSHEVNKIEQLTDDDMRAMIDDELIAAHRARGALPRPPGPARHRPEPGCLLPGPRDGQPVLRAAAPKSSRQAMDKFAALTGRQYHLFDYAGAPDAERVIVVMGSGAETAEETAKFLTSAGRESRRGHRPPVPPLLGRSTSCKALPATVKMIAVLDRTKEPGAAGEPLYLDVVTAISEGLDLGIAPFKTTPPIIGGRYGLSSKEFTPAMVKGVFDELKKAAPKNHFTIGINDDVTHTSLDYDPDLRHPGSIDRALRVLRPGRGRHRRRQQELDQDHRRRDRQLCPGLLRLRLEEIRHGHHLAPALWPQADPRRLT